MDLSGLKGYSSPKSQASTQWQIPRRLLGITIYSLYFVPPVTGSSVPSRTSHSSTTWLYLFFQETILQLPDCHYHTPALPGQDNPIPPSNSSHLMWYPDSSLQVDLPSKLQLTKNTIFYMWPLYSEDVTSFILGKMLSLMQPKIPKSPATSTSDTACNWPNLPATGPSPKELQANESWLPQSSQPPWEILLPF